MKNPAVMLNDFLKVYFDVAGPYARPAVLDKIEEIREKSEPTAAKAPDALLLDNHSSRGLSNGAAHPLEAAEVIDLAGAVAKKVDPLADRPAKRRV